LATPASSPSSKIVFASNRTGSWQIYAMDMDGSNVTRLTYLPGDNVTPTLSAGGRIIAFTHYGHVRKRLGSRDVYLMNTDGTHLRRLTAPPMSGEVPGLSPDGRKVAFSGWRLGIGTGPPSIYLVDVDGSHLTDTGHGGYAPSFSPDGRKVVFICQDQHLFHHICLLDLDGSHFIVLANLLSDQSAPRFSPDGRKIVYEDCRSEDGCYPYALIHVMDADGSNAHRIEDTSSRGAGAWFAPDGRIVFTKLRKVGEPNRWADGQICVMNQDGTQEHCLTSGPGQSVYSPFGVHF
jgi:TolB protein